MSISQKSTATVAAAAPLQHYQVDPVHQPLGLSFTIQICTSNVPLLHNDFHVKYDHRFSKVKVYDVCIVKLQGEI